MLEAYGRYGDSVAGRFGTTPKGGRAPSQRAVLKPLLALFHGDAGCKRWKQALDKHAKSAPSVSAAIQVRMLALVQSHPLVLLYAAACWLRVLASGRLGDIRQLDHGPCGSPGPLT